MATKSIFHTVRVKDKAAARKLVSALERAQNKPAKKVTATKMHREAKGQDIVSMFGKE
jgi:hypothetical protein